MKPMLFIHSLLLKLLLLALAGFNAVPCVVLNGGGTTKSGVRS